MQRTSEVSRLSRLLRETDAGLKLGAIVGPGGVGKTYLLDEVFRSEDPRALGYLQLSVDASNPQTRTDFFGLVDGQLASRSLSPPARSDYDYFPQLRKVAAVHRDVVEKAAAELLRRGVPDDVRAAAAALLRAAYVLNKTLPKTREILDVTKLGLDDRKIAEALDAAWDAVAKLSALRESIAFPGPIRDILGLTKRNRVRRDLFNFTADALCGDLAAILARYRKRDTFKLTHSPLKEFSRLLIVLDDFEATAPVLGEFLLGALLPRLAAAPYPTVVLIASRDDLEAIHPGFGQHAKRWISEQVTLRPFDRNAAAELLFETKIPEERHDAIFAATYGFPFLLSLAIEEAIAPESESALLAKKFFDRTTRWMTERERSWFVSLCYLDVINEDTIAVMVDGSDEATQIQHWFEREASIRDPIAPVFTVRPLVREKALKYLAMRSPSKHLKMLARARDINGATAS